MKKEPVIRRIWKVAARECGILTTTPIYIFCMVVFPVLIVFFFTSMMGSGQPLKMPVGIVDNDNTSTTRALIRRLDAMQTSRIVGHYPTPAEARQAIQRNEIYAFLYFPKGTTDALLSSRQPKVSFYYSSASITGGSMLMRDMKTVCTLGSAAVGQATMRARGYTDEQTMTFLQPIAIDLHAVNNPWINYNVYISTFIVPGIILLFVFLITAYSIGTELKFHRSRQLMRLAGDDIHTAIFGKLLPQTLIWLIIVYGYMWYMFGHLEFPHPGGTGVIMLLGLLAVLASQAFGVFIFGLTPSLRMSMSICSLWGVLSFSTCGAAFPIFAMDGMITALAQLFPLRHYYMIYQLNIFNGYPLSIAWFNYLALAVFIALPLFTMKNLRRAMKEFVYIP